MLQTAIDRETSEIIIRGEFFELDKIYFLIERLSGNYGRPAKHILPEFENAASLLLGLNHEIRMAESGSRELYVSYNGIHDGWLAPEGTPDNRIVKPEKEAEENERFSPFEDIILFDLDMDPDDFYDLPEESQRDLFDDAFLDVDPDEIDAYLEWLNREPTYYFHGEDYPGASVFNTYLQFRIPFAEGVLYAFILQALLSMKNEIIANGIQLAAKEPDFTREYELDFCTRRLPAELSLLEQLKESLFKCIAEVCGREKYINLRKKEAQKDFFRNLDDERIRRITDALDGCKNISEEVVNFIIDSFMP